MEAYRGQGGIQQLLAAEQDAQQTVNAARNARTARMKQAKDEAGREIFEYRAQVEQQFQKNVSESSGSANVKRLEQETEDKISQLKSESGRISNDVVQMLLRHVTVVKN